jgi:hypothetical protein
LGIRIRKVLVSQKIGKSGCRSPHILNTPNLVRRIGALSATENASDSTRLVSLGKMMPSSHSRAVA